MSFLKYVPLEKEGVKYKLIIAFFLMSVVPLLSMVYVLVDYIISGLPVSTMQIASILLCVLWLSLGGYILARRIIHPVVDLASETKNIADGHYETKVTLKRQDELGDVASSINTITDKIRGYMGELHEYSKKTALLNVRIHRKVLTLTNLMRLGDLISSGAAFKEVTDFATEKIAAEMYEDGGFCAIFIKGKEREYSLRSFFNSSGRDIDTDDIGLKLSSLEKFFSGNEYLSVDSRPLTKPWEKEFGEKLGRMNVILFPMTVTGSVVGVVMFANFGEKVEFNEEDIEGIIAFGKELVLGYQSFLAEEMVKSLEVIDTLTGLYTFSFLEQRLEEEIKRSIHYQRPCALLVINVDDFEGYSDRQGPEKAEHLLKKLGSFLRGAMPPLGKVAKFGHSEFGVILPEQNKREGLEMGEDIRRKIGEMKISPRPGDRITVSIGVGENPIDGSNAEEIIARARHYAGKAREQGKNRVVGE